MMQDPAPEQPTLQQSAAAPEPQARETVRWSFRDAWIGVGLALLAVLAAVLLTRMIRDPRTFQLIWPTIYELVFFVPVIAVLAWRRGSWITLGFRSFNSDALALGCGVVVIAYVGILIHNMLLLTFGASTQMESIQQVLKLTSPWGLAISGIIAAPLAEETFFRGFLFQGLRQGWGWNKAAIVSAAIFAVMHLDLASLIPTFLLGYALAFTFHRSNSIWPGIIMHFVVNAFGICLVLAARGVPGLQ